MSKKKRKVPGSVRGFQVECTCSAYRFPHRLGGGRCTGEAWALTKRLYGDQRVCEGCNENQGHTCGPALGIESVHYCEHYRDAIHQQK